jgi:hypothetical protein
VSIRIDRVIINLKLYLAIPLDADRSFFTLELPRRLVEKYGVNLIVYEPEEETIVRWQKQMSIDK